jgi:hypothetical protein
MSAFRRNRQRHVRVRCCCCQHASCPSERLSYSRRGASCLPSAVGSAWFSARSSYCQQMPSRQLAQGPIPAPWASSSYVPPPRSSTLPADSVSSDSDSGLGLGLGFGLGLGLGFGLGCGIGRGHAEAERVRRAERCRSATIPRRSRAHSGHAERQPSGDDVPWADLHECQAFPGTASPGVLDLERLGVGSERARTRRGTCDELAQGAGMGPWASCRLRCCQRWLVRAENQAEPTALGKHDAPLRE